jgi:hypothetical protein
MARHRRPPAPKKKRYAAAEPVKAPAKTSTKAAAKAEPKEKK